MQTSSADTLRTLLTPLSWVYGLGVRARNLGFRRGMLAIRKLSKPVISVGNLTLGGSGKTPCAMHLARTGLKRGMWPVILTRGYRGTAPGTCAVSDGKQILLGPREAGDEAFLMARHLPGVPVIKCPDRYEGGLYAGERFRSDLFILDDGFQHQRLHREVNLVLIDDPARLIQDRLVPTGRLREPLSELRRADEIVITGQDMAQENSVRLAVLAGGVPLSTMTYAPDSVVNGGGEVLSVETLRKKKAVVFCGIASPERFRNTLMGLGVDVIEFRAFRDHHEYSDQDLARLQARARETGAEMVITTEKDLVKISDPEVWALRMTAALSGETLDRIFAAVQQGVS